MSEDGRKQQAKLKELSHITEKLGCTLPQLAVGKTCPPDVLPNAPAICPPPSPWLYLLVLLYSDPEVTKPGVKVLLLFPIIV